MDLAKVVVAALLHIVFALGLAVGGYGVWWVDRHPTWDFTVPAPARWVLPAKLKHVHFISLAADRDQQKARADGLAGKLTTLETASAAKIAMAEHVAQAAKASARRAEAKGRAVLAVKPSADVCAFAKQVDAAFMEGLR